MKKIWQCLLITGALMLLAVPLVSSAGATTINLTSYIVNPSFESPALTNQNATYRPIPGWNTDTGTAYVYYPWSYAPAEDGTQEAALSTRYATATISQALNAVYIQAGAVYTLSAYVQVGSKVYDQYLIALYAVDPSGGSDILLSSSSGTVASAGPWYYEYTTYTADNSNLYGYELKIVLSGLNTDTGSREVNLDNVQLTAEVVPIPATMLLFGSGLLGLAGLRRFRKS